MLKLCIDNAALVVTFNIHILVYKGQGDGDTRWKGWSWKLLLTKIFIAYNILKSINLNISKKKEILLLL